MTQFGPISRSEEQLNFERQRERRDKGVSHENRWTLSLRLRVVRG